MKKMIRALVTAESDCIVKCPLIESVITVWMSCSCLQYLTMAYFITEKQMKDLSTTCEHTVILYTVKCINFSKG